MTTKTDVEQERADLLPCPFCGGGVIMQEHPPHKHSNWLVKMGMPEYSPGSFTIECVSCECGMIHEKREGVVSAWNRRAALQSQDEKSRSKIHDKSYAGVYVWLGDECLVEHIPKIMAESARFPESLLGVVVDNAISKLGHFVDLQSQDREDADRFRWLTDDHENKDVRMKCWDIQARMATKSYSAVCADIDHARLIEGEDK